MRCGIFTAFNVLRKRCDWILCEKILKEITDIETCTEGMDLDAFQEDEKTKKAVVMSFIDYKCLVL